MELKVLAGIGELAAEQWNGLLGTANPFLRHEFLMALERHGAVAENTGWIPQHLALFSGERLVAAAPAYLKPHSWGEFVFDFAWADAYARRGLDYYPKLISAVPFTPATGPRVMTDPTGSRDTLIGELAEAARELVASNGVSGMHWLFPQERDTLGIAPTGYSVRHGCQYHWRNPGYADFDDFLAGMTAKKRKNIRRERRLVRDSGVNLRILHGQDASDTVWRAVHRFYRRTFHLHGNLPLISEACFREMGARLGEHMLLILAERDAEPVAGAICFQGNGWLYGRYWGCDEEIDGLHFETCYYQGIDYCIRHGLEGFEPGAQGEHKVARGFLPATTYSCHYLTDPRFHEAVADFVGREAEAIAQYQQTLTEEGPFRPDALARIQASY